MSWINLKYTSLFVLLGLLHGCRSPSRLEVIEPFVLDFLQRHQVAAENQHVVAVANSACRNCGYTILDKANTLNNLVVFIDTSVYTPNRITQNVVQIANDSLSRLMYPGVSGHRLYVIQKGKLQRIKEIDVDNVDSLNHFLH